MARLFDVRIQTKNVYDVCVESEDVESAIEKAKRLVKNHRGKDEGVAESERVIGSVILAKEIKI